jgi:hypothetical protein
MRYKGYHINLVPKRTENLWQLELERGDYITAITVSNKKTLIEIQNLAYDTIDKLTEEEEKI